MEGIKNLLNVIEKKLAALSGFSHFSTLNVFVVGLVDVQSRSYFYTKAFQIKFILCVIL